MNCDGQLDRGHLCESIPRPKERLDDKAVEINTLGRADGVCNAADKRAEQGSDVDVVEGERADDGEEGAHLVPVCAALEPVRGGKVRSLSGHLATAADRAVGGSGCAIAPSAVVE